jgi:hypothetical protein
MTNFDQQLTTRLERLVAAAPATPMPAIEAHRPRLLWAVVAAAALLAVIFVAPRVGTGPVAMISVGSLQISAEQGASWSGSVDRQKAEATALAAIRRFDSAVEGLTIVETRQVAGVRTVTGPSGGVLESSEPVDAWVFSVTGTAPEWASTTGWALIDAASGKVLAAALLSTNDPESS